MSDIIQLLPDSVANQIAAGEVIQRPASVVKELVENAIDSGSSVIKINIKDSGRTLIQVIDNGCGMSGTDARMAFERHATSKISKAEDLFSILTMGFRGEALASIAAISQLELRTRQHDAELGTLLCINGTELTKQEVCSCPGGSNFMIKNLFFNVPARRKFLKSNSTELRHIIEEVQRVAFSHPEISFVLQHNESEIYNLPAGNFKQRILSIIGKKRDQNLISLNTDTSLAKIHGYIGKPEFAKKTSGEQYFFVNKRFMKHPYYYKAVLQAYNKILPPGNFPSFFIMLEVDPETIDINIHPTKTEIKFENETAVWQILHAAVKESLGKFNIVPSLDFDTETAYDFPMQQTGETIKAPEIKVNTNYNPFENQSRGKLSEAERERQNDSLENWEKLYSGFDTTQTNTETLPQDSLLIESESNTPDKESSTGNFFQLKNKYIMTPVKSGLMIIDQKRAHERILYEKYLIALENHAGASQKTLFPISVELSHQDFELVKEIMDDFRYLGFDISEFGKNTICINGSPADILNADIIKTLENFLEIYKNNKIDIKFEARDNIAGSLAKAAAINYGKRLSEREMRELVDQLFACSAPNYSSDGKTIISILDTEELEKRFK